VIFDEVKDKKHQFCIAVIDGIPHVIDSAAVAKQIKSLGIPMIECYSEYPCPDWPMLHEVTNIFGGKDIASSVDAFISQDERLD
jgi:hypothetical protein